MSEFDATVTRAHQQVKTVGMKPSDIARAVAKVRGQRPLPQKNLLCPFVD